MYSKLFTVKKKNEHGKRSFLQLLVGIIVLCMAIYCLLLRNSKIDHVTWAQENRPSKSFEELSEKQNESSWKRIQELHESLEKKEEEIEEKNLLLEKKEQQLSLIKQEIIKQIETLQSLQREIEQGLKHLNEQEEKRVKEILKLFERTPMDQACSIISTLAETNISTVIEIIMRMDKRKAKRLWENVDPKLAARITTLVMKKNELQKVN